VRRGGRPRNPGIKFDETPGHGVAMTELYFAVIHDDKLVLKIEKKMYWVM
jgi:hypothetical protein